VPYCTCPNQESSLRVAKELRRRGFTDVQALEGGFDAWKRAGGTLEQKPA
jgi:rhodanese-related sulfurtransferase